MIKEKTQENKVAIWVPNSLVTAPCFVNLEPIDLGFESWKSSRIHQRNIVLVYWTIQCRVQGKNESVPVSSRCLEKRAGRNYRRYLDWLVRHEFIQEERQYFPGEKSRQYLTRATGDFTSFTVSKPKRLRQAINPERLTVLERLTFDQLHTLDFNTEVALKVFETLKNSAKPGATHSIIEFSLKDFRPYESTKVGRIYSPVTNLISALRPALTWNGSPIYQVDICNSQALCLAALAGCPKFLETAQLGTVYEDIQQGIGVDDRKLAKRAFLIYAFGPNSNRQPSLTGRTEEELFRAVNVSKEQLARRRKTYRRKKRVVPSDVVLARKIADPAITQELRARMELYFRREFPLVAERLDEMKAGPKGAHKNVSQQLQKLEAHCLLLHCFQPLAERGIPVLTVHDSVLTTRDHLEEVAKYVEAQFSAAMGNVTGNKVNASVKKDTWSKEKQEGEKERERRRDKEGVGGPMFCVLTPSGQPAEELIPISNLLI